MAITKMSNSGIASTGSEKYNDMLAGNPPFIPTDFESIATATTGSAGVVTFSSIPSTYKHLQLRYMARVSSQTQAYLRFNGDTGSNYAWTYLSGTGVGRSSTGYANQAQIGFTSPEVGLGTSFYGVGIVDIIDYQSTTKLKTVRTFCGMDTNGSEGGDVVLEGGLWTNTNAINSITITTLGTNFGAGTVFSLYGIVG